MNNNGLEKTSKIAFLAVLVLLFCVMISASAAAENYQRPCGDIDDVDLCTWDSVLPLGSPDTSNCGTSYNTYWEPDTITTVQCNFNGDNYINEKLYFSIDNDVINCTLNGNVIVNNVIHEGCAEIDPRDEYEYSITPSSGTNTIVCVIEDRGTMSHFDACVVGECPDNDGDGYLDAACGGDDCNDNDASINPGANDVCNGVDDDCDSNTADGSGETTPLNSNQNGVCFESEKTCTNGAWIDDYSQVANYEVPEVTCDALDNDCDGSTDEYDNLNFGCYDECIDGVLVDTTGPTTSTSTTVPMPNNGHFDVTSHAEDTCSNIEEAEYFLSTSYITCGNPGTGTPLEAFDGDFDELIEDLIDEDAEFLHDGSNMLCVQSKDSEDNWGNCDCMVFETDTIPPELVYDFRLNNESEPDEYLICGDNPEAFVTICDTQSQIQGGEFFLNLWVPPSPIPAPWTGYWLEPLNQYMNNGWHCSDLQGRINLSDFEDLMDGTHYINQIRGKDVVENWGKIYGQNFSYSFIKDTTPPVVEKTLVPYDNISYTCGITEMMGKNLTHGCTFVKEGTEVQLTSYDPDPMQTGEFAGDVVIHYKVWWSMYGDNWTVVQEGESGIDEGINFSLYGESYHLIEFWAVDKCGWESEHYWELDIIDLSAPITEKTVVGPQVDGDLNPIHKYITEDTIIKLACSDVEPHPVEMEYIWWELYWSEECVDPNWSETPIDSGFQNDGYVEITDLDDSCHKLVYKCIDGMGNMEVEQIEIDAVDNSEPELNKTVGEPKVDASNLYYYGIDNYDWYVTQNTPFTLTCEDVMPHPVGNVTIYYEYYRIDSQTEEPIFIGMANANELNFTYERDSAHRLDYWCVDELGNTVEKVEYDIVDTVGPEVVDKEFFGPHIYCNDDDKLLYNDCHAFISQDTVIRLTAEDVEPHPVGIDYCEYRYSINGGNFSEWMLGGHILPELDEAPCDGDCYQPPSYYFEIQYEEDSIHTVEYKCVDKLGNWGQTYTEVDVVDTQAPELVKTVGEPKVVVNEGGEYTINEGPFDVLIIHANAVDHLSDVVAKVSASDDIDVVDTYDARYGTPTLDYLDDYDSVLVWSNYYYGNPTALGNVLADYSDIGGGVTLMTFSWYSGFKLEGRYMNEEYGSIPFGDYNPYSSGSLGTIHNPAHPIMNGVSSFSTGDYRSGYTGPLNTGAELIASYTDGMVLAAVHDHGDARTCDLGFFPPSSDAHSSSWDVNTDGDVLMQNCLLWTAGGTMQGGEELTYITQDTNLTFVCNDLDPHPVGNETIEYRIRWKYDFDDEWDEWSDWMSFNTNMTVYNFDEDSIHEVEYRCYDALDNYAGSYYEVDIVDTQAPDSHKFLEGPVVTNHEVYSGEPDYTVGGEEGIFIWKDGDIWKIRWTADGNPLMNVKGTITGESGNFEVVETYLYEDGGHVDEMTWNPKKIEFDAYVNTGEDGIDFTFSGHYVTFDLYYEGYDDVKSVTFIGENNVNPISMPFSLPFTWVTQETNVTLTCNDLDPHPVQGEEIFYRIWYKEFAEDDWTVGDFDEYTGTFQFTEDSYHMIEFYCVDELGNEEEHRFEVDYVDTLPPVTTKSVGEPKVECDEENCHYWVTDETEISLSCTDEGEHPVGKDYLEYRYFKDGVLSQDWLYYEGPFTFTDGDSNHTLEYRCVDLLENFETIQVEYDRVDTAPPTVIKKFVTDIERNRTYEVIEGEEIIVPVQGDADLLFCAEIIDYKQTGDAGVGVDWAEMSLTNERIQDLTEYEENIYCKEITVQEDCGELHYKVRAGDRLDNDGEWVNGITVIIDNVAPVGIILNPHAGNSYYAGKVFPFYAPAVDFGGDKCKCLPGKKCKKHPDCPAVGVDYCKVYAIDYDFESLNQSEIQKCYWDIREYLEQVSEDPVIEFLGEVPYVDGVCKGYLQIPEDTELTDTVFMAWEIVDKAGNGEDELHIGLNPGEIPDFWDLCDPMTYGTLVTMDIYEKGNLSITEMFEAPVTSGQELLVKAEITDINSPETATCKAIVESYVEEDETVYLEHDEYTPEFNPDTLMYECMLSPTLPGPEGVPSGSYKYTVKYLLGNQVAGMDSFDFLVDNLRPEVDIVSPEMGGVYGANFPVSMLIEDDVAGVAEETVYFRLSETPRIGNLFCVFGDCEDTGWVEVDGPENDLFTSTTNLSAYGITGDKTYLFDAVACDTLYVPEENTLLGFSLGNSQTDLHCRMLSEHGVEALDRPQCNDGLDNDGDGNIDYPEDIGCESLEDDDEVYVEPVYVYECNDGIDNDDDGYIDYPEDEGCDSLEDDYEGQIPS